MHFLITLAIILGAQSAFAGFMQITGKASGFIEYGESFDLQHKIASEADSDARRQCPSWMPIRRTSEYRIKGRQISYFGYKFLVQADYICGESDY